MMKSSLKKFSFAAILSLGTATYAQTQLDIDVSETIAEIQPTMYGIFFEDINFAADGGLYAELIKNRSFEFELPMMGWEEPNSDRHSYNNNSGIASPVKYSDGEANKNYIRVKIEDPSGYELINEGYRGMGVKEGDTYRLSFKARNTSGSVESIKAQLVSENGDVLGETSLETASEEWKTYEKEFTASGSDAKANFKLTFSGKGSIDLDMISLFPKDTWKGRKNGLRKDLVQLLDDLNPGFLRFPGGCIVEGRTLAKRYQWKKSVGPVEERPALINRWNTEFSHRPTPDYFQSFGIGFFEYFQLAEDMEAEPLPILSCGIACQFNTGELVPMEDLDPYVQDALDLIEFANGDTSTAWGKVRADMGHPEPFNMNYIGVGNEQWGPEYIERFKVFQNTIKEQYPDIIIVSGSGPFPEGDFFEYGMEELKKLDSEIIDEHYYKPPQWFRKNATRYDDYDRNGPKIFAGEYAAQSVAIASPENENNWETALSEAAFMTGLERNAEVVHLTSYAPLMAHEDGWQWTPDLIWFNNTESYGTPNYYVQKLFGNNPGSDLVKVTSNSEPLTGQEELFASATLDKEKNQAILKIVNTSDQAKQIKLNLTGKKIKNNDIEITTLMHEDLSAMNSFDTPDNIIPKTKKVSQNTIANGLELNAYSVNIIKLNLR